MPLQQADISATSQESIIASVRHIRHQQPLRCGSFPKAAAFSTPLSHSLHFLTTVSSTSPSSSSYSTSSYLYWSFNRDILTMAVMSCSASSALATGAQPFDPPCAFLEGKTRLCRKSADAQHFCCFASICFSRFRFWMTRMASGVRLRVNWSSFFPSSLPWSCLLESMELERRTPSDESWGLGNVSQEHFPCVSWPAPGFCAELLLFSCWAFRPKFLKFAAVHDVDCLSLSDSPFSPPDLLVSSVWGGTPLAFFFPNRSLPGEEIRWWRLMGGKGIFCDWKWSGYKNVQMFKVQMRKSCAKRPAAVCGHHPTARWREAVLHLLAALTGSRLAITHTVRRLYGRAGREAWSWEAPNKAMKDGGDVIS